VIFAAGTDSLPSAIVKSPIFEPLPAVRVPEICAELAYIIPSPVTPNLSPIANLNPAREVPLIVRVKSADDKAIELSAFEVTATFAV